MFKLPEDIRQRSKSTQIQWAIMGIMFVGGLLFIQISGIVYILNQLGFTVFNLSDTIGIWIGSILVVLITQYFQIKKRTKKMRELTTLLEETIEDIRTKVNEASEANEDDNLKREVIPVTYLGKTVPIIIAYEPVDDISEEDSIMQIMDGTFEDMVIEARRTEKEDTEE